MFPTQAGFVLSCILCAEPVFMLKKKSERNTRGESSSGEGSARHDSGNSSYELQWRGQGYPQLSERSFLYMRFWYLMVVCRRPKKFENVRSVFRSLGNNDQHFTGKERRNLIRFDLEKSLIRKIFWFLVLDILNFKSVKTESLFFR